VRFVDVAPFVSATFRHPFKPGTVRTHMLMYHVLTEPLGETGAAQKGREQTEEIGTQRKCRGATRFKHLQGWTKVRRKFFRA